ncbi:hypothetical protein [Rhodanobacter sp. FW106-PBR-LB-2-11]|uniref:hypothetical protein n=1 Tax=Rhodanobacter sp. FW106-PBR-LB-2-11 TaxID=1524463 RepID=UPI0034E5F870
MTAESPVPSPSGQTVYLNAHSCAEFGDSPAWVEWQVNPALVARLEALNALGIQHGLSAIEIQVGVDWMPSGIAEELRLGEDILVLRPGTHAYLWIRSYPKYAGGPVGCSQVTLTALSDALNSGEAFPAGDRETIEAAMALAKAGEGEEHAEEGVDG